ncbi:MAG: protein kinase [Candidatus Obscuribacterales bacterium]
MSGESEDLAKVNLDLVGRIVDQKYKVLALLGRGGMGAVYLAHHLRLDKDVALKTFTTTNLSDETKQRFKREAQALGKLQHKNIVQVFDFGIADGGLPYCAMERLDGESVAERIARKGALNVAEALYIFSELCQGLLFCHKNGVVHRDIKPANIFLELQSSTSDAIAGVKLVDFGIAALSATASAGQQLTAAGTVFGSPLYMSPEQSMGLRVDGRSDIYSSGCALFEMLTGKPPFRAATAFATMLCHQEVPAPTLVEAGGLEQEQTYPDWLEELVAELLAKDPAARPQSFSEVLDVIGEHTKQLDSHSPSPERLSPAAGQSKGAIDGRFKVFLLIVVLPLFALGTFLAVPQFNSLPLQSPVSVQPDKVPVPLVVGAYRLPSKRAGFIRFQFPDKKIGEIGQGDESKCIPACGVIEIADGPAVVFRAGQAICDQPELLRGFGSSDLFAVLFEDGIAGNWNDKTVASIEHLSSLKKVIISGGKFSPAAVDSLNKLPGLIDLGLSDSALTGEEMLGLKCLAKLQSFVVSETKNASPLIANLAQHNSLVHFTAQDCQLGDDDMQAIGGMTMLLTLNIEENSITAKCLPVLLKLVNLKELNLFANPIDQSALPVMLKIKTPMTISMPTSFWTTETIAPMEKRFGATNLNSKGYLR